jgi:hypothetical protein
LAADNISMSMTKAISNPGTSADSESTTSVNEKSLTITSIPKPLNIVKPSVFTEKPALNTAQSVISSPFKPPTKTSPSTSISLQSMVFYHILFLYLYIKLANLIIIILKSYLFYYILFFIN